MVIQTKSSGSYSGAESSHNESSEKSESAKNVLNALRKRKQQSMKSGAESLESLRENLQYFFNDKIMTLMTNFVQTFFDPAIQNIRENTHEIISDEEVKKICRNLIESCLKSQYSSGNESISSPSSSSFSSNTAEVNTSDSDTSENGGTTVSLLHQALKRKRTNSESEQLFKRQFFLTTAPHYSNFVGQQNQGKTIFKPSNTVLTTSAPRFITRPIQAATGTILAQSGTSTRPIFHIIQAPNRNLKLSALRHNHIEHNSKYIELCQLLQQNKNTSVNVPAVTITHEQSTSTTTTTVTTQASNKTPKEQDTKN